MRKHLKKWISLLVTLSLLLSILVVPAHGFGPGEQQVQMYINVYISRHFGYYGGSNNSYGISKTIYINSNEEIIPWAVNAVLACEDSWMRPARQALLTHDLIRGYYNGLGVQPDGNNGGVSVWLFVGGGTAETHSRRVLLDTRGNQIGVVPSDGCGDPNCIWSDCCMHIEYPYILDPAAPEFKKNQIFSDASSALGSTFVYNGLLYTYESGELINDARDNSNVNIGAMFHANGKLNLYYIRTPKASAVSYQLTGAVPAGITPPSAAGFMDGDTVTVQPAAGAPGYDFSGWSTADASVSGPTFMMPPNNVTFTGSYIPRTDTPYTVEFYKQDAPNSASYTRQTGDTLSGTGATGAQIRAALDMAAMDAKYSGYHLTDASKIDATAISGDGSAALRLYYDMDTSNVSYLYVGSIPAGAPGAPAAAEYHVGSNVQVPAAPSLAGYSFSGWSSNQADLSAGSFSMPAGAVFVTGSWTPRSDTPFTVQYYQQNTDNDDYKLAETKTYQGTTDAQATFTAVSYPGFTMTPASVVAMSAATISGDGSTLLKLYYDRNVNQVSYGYTGDTDTEPPALPEAHSYRYGQTVTLAPEPALAGYDFGGWQSSGAEISGGQFVMPDGPVRVTGCWNPRDDTPYAVEYYHQNTEDDDYTMVETLNGNGVTGGVIPHREFDGFTETPDSVAAEGSTQILSNGSTLLKLYYDRNVNQVSYGYTGDTDTEPPALPEAHSYRYGQTVTLAPEPALAGYDFGGWQSSDAEISDGQFVMPDQPVDISGTWGLRGDTPFIVEYYHQNTEDDDYTLAETFHGEGTAGGGIPHREFDGFTETPDSVAVEGNTKILSNGSTRLELYYDRNVNQVSYGYTGDTDTEPPALPEAHSYRYGQTVTLAPEPALDGYDFDGWQSSDFEISDGQFVMPDKPVSISGNWGLRSDTPFIVEYYQQNTEDDDYTLAETYHGQGAAGESIPHREFDGFTETPDSVDIEGSTKILSNGSTCLKLYYDRNVNQVSYGYTGVVDATPPALPEAQSFRYGQMVKAPTVPSLSGYNFSGWTSEDVNLASGAFSMPDTPVSITGSWRPAPSPNPGGGAAGPVPQTPEQPVQTLDDTGAAYILGYEDGTFRPDDFLTAKHEYLMLSRLGLSMTPLSGDSSTAEGIYYLTRREFLSALLSAAGANSEDIDDPMLQAAALGWITGYADGEAYPDAYITRAQAVTIINRAFGRTAAQEYEAEITYADLPRDHWAYEEILAASVVM